MRLQILVQYNTYHCKIHFVLTERISIFITLFLSDQCIKTYLYLSSCSVWLMMSYSLLNWVFSSSRSSSSWFWASLISLTSSRLKASLLWPSPSACWPWLWLCTADPPAPAGFPLLSAEMEALPEEHSSSLGYLGLPTKEVLLLSPFPALSVGSGEEASRVVLRWAMLSALPNLFLMRLANSLGLLKKKGGERETPGPMVLILSMVGCRPLPVISLSSCLGDSLGIVLCLAANGWGVGLWWVSLSFIFRWYCSSFFCIWAMFCADFWFFFSNTCLMRPTCCLSALFTSFRYSATFSSRAVCSIFSCSVTFSIFCWRLSKQERLRWTSNPKAGRGLPSIRSRSKLFSEEPRRIDTGMPRGLPSVLLSYKTGKQRPDIVFDSEHMNDSYMHYE